MNKKELEAFAKEAAKGIKTEKDLNDFRQMLTKVTVETALNAELDDHLGYDKHAQSSQPNSRMALAKRHYGQTMASFLLIPLGIVMAVLSPLWSRNIKPVSLPWTIKF